MAGVVDDSITIVDNLAGILGGIKLWEPNSHWEVASHEVSHAALLGEAPDGAES